MRYIRLICTMIAGFLGVFTYNGTAQQINPVPDYIFRNQMSVGRNAPTDTAAYLSVGPRFGAVKGFMPPMVVDTNAVTGVKRNGLLIFSVQLNNFAYWDSTTSRFRQITATPIIDSLVWSTRAWRQKGDDSVSALVAAKLNISDTATMLGAYLRKGDTASMLSPYVRIAGVGLTKGTQTLSADTVTLATRVRVQKAVDSLGSVKQNTLTNPVTGTGTTNRVAKFTGASTIGSSNITDNGSSILLNTTTASIFGPEIGAKGTFEFVDSLSGIRFHVNSSTIMGGLRSSAANHGDGQNDMSLSAAAGRNLKLGVGGSGGVAMLINPSKEILMGTGTDVGNFILQVSGNSYVSGNMGINSTNPGQRLAVEGSAVTAEDVLRVNNNAEVPTRIWLRNNSRSGYWILNGNTLTDTTFGTGVFENGSMAFHNNSRTAIQFANRNLNNTNSVKMSIMQNGSVSIGNVDTTYALNVTGVGRFSDAIRTGAPTGGTEQPWRLGEIATVSPTSPNRTIRVEINGTVYYIHAKTTND